MHGPTSADSVLASIVVLLYEAATATATTKYSSAALLPPFITATYRFVLLPPLLLPQAGARQRSDAQKKKAGIQQSIAGAAGKAKSSAGSGGGVDRDGGGEGGDGSGVMDDADGAAFEQRMLKQMAARRERSRRGSNTSMSTSCRHCVQAPP